MDQRGYEAPSASKQTSGLIGPPFAYCAELVENDGLPISAVPKSVKRAMARYR